MRIYIDWPWSDDVVYYGAPLRAYIHTKRWMYIFGARSQVWDPQFGNTLDFKVLTKHPNREYVCGFELEDAVTCPLLKGHETRHWNWRRGWKQT